MAVDAEQSHNKWRWDLMHRNMVPLKDAEDSMDWICQQLQSFRGNGSE